MIQKAQGVLYNDGGARRGAPRSVISILENSHPSSQHPRAPSATAQLQLGAPWPRMAPPVGQKAFEASEVKLELCVLAEGNRPFDIAEAVCRLLWFFQYSTINKSITFMACFSGHKISAVLDSTTHILQMALL